MTMAACDDAAIAMGLQTGGVAGPGCPQRVPISIDSIVVTRRDSTALTRRALFAQAELFDQRSITVGVAGLQVIEKLAPPRHHPQQTAPRVVILDVRLEMIVEPVDAGGQQRDLDLRRSGVARRTLVIGDDLRLVCNRNGHVPSSFACSALG